MTRSPTLARHLRFRRGEQRFRVPLTEDAGRADAGAAQPGQVSDQRRTADPHEAARDAQVLPLADVDLDRELAHVTGKGARPRDVPFGARTSQASAAA